MSEKTKKGDVLDESGQVSDVDNANREPTSIMALYNVLMKVEIVIGRANLSLAHVSTLKRGDVVDLDRMIGDDVDLMVNNHLIGHGKLVNVGQNGIGVKLTDVVHEIRVPTN